MITPDIYLGVVKSFDASSWTIDVELNSGPTLPEVTIKAVMNDETSGIFVEPVVGSYVLVGTVDGRLENCSVLLYSEIKRMEIMPSDLLKLKGDQYGGLVILEKLVANLDALKGGQDDLKAAIRAGLQAVGAGSAANGATGKVAFDAAIANSLITFENMENQNVQHG
jgi:hypothetical protein